MDAPEAEEHRLAVGEDLGDRRVPARLGEVPHLAVADGVAEAPVLGARAVGVVESVLEGGGPQPAVAALRVPALGGVLRQAFGPEAGQRVAEEEVQQPQIAADGAVVDQVGHLVRDHLAEPLHVARPDVGRVVDVDPDGGEPARPDVEGDAIGDLVLVGEVDPDGVVEDERGRVGAESDREGVIGRLGDRGGLGLDAGEVGRVHDLEVLGRRHLPVDLGVVAPVERPEADLRGRRSDGEGQQDEERREAVHRGRPGGRRR